MEHPNAADVTADTLTEGGTNAGPARTGSAAITVRRSGSVRGDELNGTGWTAQEQSDWTLPEWEPCCNSAGEAASHAHLSACTQHEWSEEMAFPLAISQAAKLLAGERTKPIAIRIHGSSIRLR